MKKSLTNCLVKVSGSLKAALMLIMIVGLGQLVSAQAPSCNFVRIVPVVGQEADFPQVHELRPDLLEACAGTNSANTDEDIYFVITVNQSGINGSGGGVGGVAPSLTNLDFVSNNTGAIIRPVTEPMTHNVPLNRSFQIVSVWPGPGPGGNNFEIHVDVLNNFSGETGGCGPSITLFTTSLTLQADPIECFGGTTTIEATGTSMPATSLTYILGVTIIGPQTDPALFTDINGSEAGIEYKVEVVSEFGCTAEESITIFEPAENPIILDCPDDVNADACQTQEAIDAAFQAWLDDFDYSGGANTSSSFDPAEPEAPSACGGTITVTFRVTGDCDQEESCTKTFTVGNSSSLSLDCAADKEIACGEAIVWDEPTPVNACGEADVTVFSTNTVENPDGSKTHTRVWHATDNCTSEPVSCDQVITEAPCTGEFWGCTPGWWKNHVSGWDQAGDAIPTCVNAASTGLGYTGGGHTSSLVRNVLGVTSAEMTAVGLNPNLTMLQATASGGGGFQKLLRHGITALLNTCGIADHYPFNGAQVITLLHDAIVNKVAEPTASQFAAANEQEPDICPGQGGNTTGGGKIGRTAGDYPEALEAIQLFVSPNPSSSVVNMTMIFKEAKANVVLEIFTVTGQKLAELYNGSADGNFEYRMEYNVSQLPIGAYFYRLNDGDNTQIGKLSVVR